MNSRRLPGLLALAMMAVGLACSSSSGSGGVTIFCAKSPWSCRCQNSDFTLEPWETATPDCNSLPQGSVCCSDLSASGKSTACECAEFVCVMGANCDCGYQGYWGKVTLVSQCNQAGDETCCVDTTGTCSCAPASMYPPSYCTSKGGTVMPSCPTTPNAAQTQAQGSCTQLYTGAGASGRPLTSCAGLNWASP